MDPARAADHDILSIGIVGLQLLALAGVITTTEKPACLDSSDCPRGDFCRVVFSQDYEGGTCQHTPDLL